VLVVWGLVVETAMPVAAIIMVQIWFTQLEEANETWDHKSQETEQLLEGSKSKDEG
jgi:hypothetical protein